MKEQCNFQEVKKEIFKVEAGSAVLILTEEGKLFLFLPEKEGDEITLAEGISVALYEMLRNNNKKLGELIQKFWKEKSKQYEGVFLTSDIGRA